MIRILIYFDFSFFQMILLAIHETSLDLLNEALTYFPVGYKSWLEEKPYFEESIIWRLKISQAIWGRYLPKEEEGIPYMHDENCWSLSHKKWLVFFWVSDKKLWVDIEIYKQRDLSLLDTFSQEEYDQVWWRDWKSFYLLWTAHE